MVDGSAAFAATNYRYRSDGGTDEDTICVKNAAGILYGVTITNTNAAIRYVRLYNQATAPASTDTANLWRTYAVPATGGIRETFPLGVAFTTGLGHRFTTDEADNAATDVAAGDLHLMLEYV